MVVLTNIFHEMKQSMAVLLIYEEGSGGSARPIFTRVVGSQVHFLFAESHEFSNLWQRLLSAPPRYLLTYIKEDIR